MTPLGSQLMQASCSIRFHPSASLLNTYLSSLGLFNNLWALIESRQLKAQGRHPGLERKVNRELMPYCAGALRRFVYFDCCGFRLFRL